METLIKSLKLYCLSITETKPQLLFDCLYCIFISNFKCGFFNNCFNMLLLNKQCFSVFSSYYYIELNESEKLKLTNEIKELNSVKDIHLLINVMYLSGSFLYSLIHKTNYNDVDIYINPFKLPLKNRFLTLKVVKNIIKNAGWEKNIVNEDYINDIPDFLVYNKKDSKIQFIIIIDSYNKSIKQCINQFDNSCVKMYIKLNKTKIKSFVPQIRGLKYTSFKSENILKLNRVKKYIDRGINIINLYKIQHKLMKEYLFIEDFLIQFDEYFNKNDDIFNKLQSNEVSIYFSAITINKCYNVNIDFTLLYHYIKIINTKNGSLYIMKINNIYDELKTKEKINVYYFGIISLQYNNHLSFFDIISFLNIKHKQYIKLNIFEQNFTNKHEWML